MCEAERSKIIYEWKDPTILEKLYTSLVKPFGLHIN